MFLMLAWVKDKQESFALLFDFITGGWRSSTKTGAIRDRAYRKTAEKPLTVQLAPIHFSPTY